MSRILIVDADLASATTLAALLRESSEPPFVVTVATSTAEAQQHVDQSDSDFDIFLIAEEFGSDADVITTLQTLRLQSPRTVSIVLFTVYKNETERRVYRAGAHHYLPKEIDGIALLWVLRSANAKRPPQLGGRDWIGLLARIADEIQRTPSADEVADAIVRGGLQLGFERARLWLFDAHRKILIGRTQAGNKGLDDFPGSEMPLRRSYYWKHMRKEREPRIFRARILGPSFVDGAFGKAGFEAPIGDWAILPLWSGRTFLGVLSLDDANALRVIDDDQHELLRIFSRLAVAALERAREGYERDSLEKLTKMAEEAQGKHSVLEVGDVVVKWAVEIGFKRARLYQYRADQRTLMGLSQHGNSGLKQFVGFSMPIDDSEYCKDLLSQREPVYFDGRKEGMGYVDRHFLDFEPPQYEWVIIPLWIGDQCLGMLAMDNANRQRRFTTEQKALLRLLSRQVVAVLERVRASYSLAKLTEIAEEAQRGHSVEEVAKVIVSIGRAIGFQRARLWQIVQSANEMVLVGLHQEGNMGLEDFSGKEVPFAESPYLQLILNSDMRDPMYFPGREKNPAYLDKISQNFTPPSGEWVEIPLWSNNKLLGTLTLDNGNEPYSIHPHHHGLMKLLGQQAAAALERAQIAAKRRLETALQIFEAVDETLFVDETIHAILSKLQLLFPGSSPFILIYDESKHELVFTKGSTDKFYRIDNPAEITRQSIGVGNTSIAGKLAEDSLKPGGRKIINVGDVRYHQQQGFPYLKLIQSTNSEICVALTIDGRLIGVLAIEHKNINAFEREAEELLLVIKDNISAALHRARKSDFWKDRLSWMYMGEHGIKERLIDQMGYHEDVLRNEVSREINEVLMWLFSDLAQDRLKVEYYKHDVLNPPHTQQRNSEVLRIWISHESYYYFKIGRCQRIEEEISRFQTYVNGNVSHNFYAVYDRSKILKHIGGVVYNFDGKPASNFINFGDYFLDKKTKAEDIKTSLRLLFNSWSGHYGRAINHRDELFGGTKGKSAKEDPLGRLLECETLFELYNIVWETRWHIRMEQFLKNADTLWSPEQHNLNPIKWLLNHVGRGTTGRADFSAIPNIAVAVTHGDLNGDDMFVDTRSGIIYISDYKRTGPGHILQDFLELEVNILVRYLSLEAADREAFEILVNTVLSLPHDMRYFDTESKLQLSQPEAIKVWEVICELRLLMHQHCYKHINPSDSPALIESYMKQILWGLLFNAANLATLLHQRNADPRWYEHALLLASLICERLEPRRDRFPPPVQHSSRHSSVERQSLSEELEQERALLQREQGRLRQLQLQKASYGIDAPPHVSEEIEDLNSQTKRRERKIAELEQQLGRN